MPDWRSQVTSASCAAAPSFLRTLLFSDSVSRTMLHRLFPKVFSADKPSAFTHTFATGRVLLEQHNGCIPHINLIPPELLSDIFTHAHHTSDNWLTGSVRSYEAPMLLLRICKHWSAVATATPNLWSNMSYTLEVDDGWANVGRADRDSAMINNWLQRSDSPLSLQLDTTSFFVVSERTTHPVLDVFVTHCHRWQTINFSLYERLIPVLNTVKCCPMLRAVEIAVAGLSLKSEHTLYAFEHAPLLRDVTLHIHPQMIKIPWGQLTHCSIEGGYECLDIMRQSLVVETFSLELKGTSRSSILPPITLGSLLTLNIYSHVADLHPILDHILAPALADITFRSSAMYGSTQTFQFVPFLSRCSSTIQSIALCHVHPTEDELIRCLRETPSLRKLTIKEVILANCVGHTLLQALHACGGSSICLVRNLQEIVLCGSFAGWDEDLFVDAVESRWRMAKVVNECPNAIQNLGCLQLKKVALMFASYHTMSKQTYRRLDEMKGEGLLVLCFRIIFAEDGT